MHTATPPAWCTVGFGIRECLEDVVVDGAGDLPALNLWQVWVGELIGAGGFRPLLHPRVMSVEVEQPFPDLLGDAESGVSVWRVHLDDQLAAVYYRVDSHRRGLIEADEHRRTGTGDFRHDWALHLGAHEWGDELKGKQPMAS